MSKPGPSAYILPPSSSSRPKPPKRKDPPPTSSPSKQSTKKRIKLEGNVVVKVEEKDDEGDSRISTRERMRDGKRKEERDVVDGNKPMNTESASESDQQDIKPKIESDISDGMDVDLKEEEEKDDVKPKQEELHFGDGDRHRGRDEDGMRNVISEEEDQVDEKAEIQVDDNDDDNDDDGDDQGREDIAGEPEGRMGGMPRLDAAFPPSPYRQNQLEHIEEHGAVQQAERFPTIGDSFPPSSSSRQLSQQEEGRRDQPPMGIQRMPRLTDAFGPRPSSSRPEHDQSRLEESLDSDQRIGRMSRIGDSFGPSFHSRSDAQPEEEEVVVAVVTDHPDQSMARIPKIGDSFGFPFRSRQISQQEKEDFEDQSSMRGGMSGIIDSFGPRPTSSHQEDIQSEEASPSSSSVREIGRMPRIGDSFRPPFHSREDSQQEEEDQRWQVQIQEMPRLTDSFRPRPSSYRQEDAQSGQVPSSSNQHVEIMPRIGDSFRSSSYGRDLSQQEQDQPRQSSIQSMPRVTDPFGPRPSSSRLKEVQPGEDAPDQRRVKMPLLSDPFGPRLRPDDHQEEDEAEEIHAGEEDVDRQIPVVDGVNLPSGPSQLESVSDHQAMDIDVNNTVESTPLDNQLAHSEMDEINHSLEMDQSRQMQSSDISTKFISSSVVASDQERLDGQEEDGMNDVTVGGVGCVATSSGRQEDDHDLMDTGEPGGVYGVQKKNDGELSAGDGVSSPTGTYPSHSRPHAHPQSQAHSDTHNSSLRTQQTHPPLPQSESSVSRQDRHWDTNAVASSSGTQQIGHDQEDELEMLVSMNLDHDEIMEGLVEGRRTPKDGGRAIAATESVQTHTIARAKSIANKSLRESRTQGKPKFSCAVRKERLLPDYDD